MYLLLLLIRTQTKLYCFLIHLVHVYVPHSILSLSSICLQLENTVPKFSWINHKYYSR